MFLFFLSSVFEYAQNNYALQILVWFPDQYTPIYYFGTGFSNLFVILLRFFIISLKLAPLKDVTQDNLTRELIHF